MIVADYEAYYVLRSYADPLCKQETNMDVSLVFACLVVFGEDASWPEEWPKEKKANFALIKSKYEKWTFDLCSAWFRDVYKPQILNGDLLEFSTVFKQANRLATRAVKAEIASKLKNQPKQSSVWGLHPQVVDESDQ